MMPLCTTTNSLRASDTYRSGDSPMSAKPWLDATRPLKQHLRLQECCVVIVKQEQEQDVHGVGTCGWLLMELGMPCVAHRVCAIPVWLSNTRARSTRLSASSEYARATRASTLPCALITSGTVAA